MPGGWFVYAASEISWIVLKRSGEPLTLNLPGSHSRSSSDASRRWAASLRALSRILRAATAVAAPLALDADARDDLARRVDADLARVEHLDAEDVEVVRGPGADDLGERAD